MTRDDRPRTSRRGQRPQPPGLGPSTMSDLSGSPGPKLAPTPLPLQHAPLPPAASRARGPRLHQAAARDRHRRSGRRRSTNGSPRPDRAHRRRDGVQSTSSHATFRWHPDRTGQIEEVWRAWLSLPSMRVRRAPAIPPDAVARASSVDLGGEFAEHGQVAAGALPTADDAVPILGLQLGIGGLAVHPPVDVSAFDHQGVEVVR